jgi:hypothetical protein
MTDDQPANATDADELLRRLVAIAYRGGRQAGKSHAAAYEDAMMVYNDVRPGEERLAASVRVAEMIASAINADPAWFWMGIPSEADPRRHPPDGDSS